MKVLHMITFTLLAIGGLNWGIYGATNMSTNVVNKLLGRMSWLEMLIYILVGVATIVELATHKHNCKHCDKAALPSGPAM